MFYKCNISNIYCNLHIHQPIFVDCALISEQGLLEFFTIEIFYFKKAARLEK